MQRDKSSSLLTLQQQLVNISTERDEHWNKEVSVCLPACLPAPGNPVDAPMFIYNFIVRSFARHPPVTKTMDVQHQTAINRITRQQRQRQRCDDTGLPLDEENGRLFHIYCLKTNVCNSSSSTGRSAGWSTEASIYLYVYD